MRSGRSLPAPEALLYTNSTLAYFSSPGFFADEKSSTEAEFMKAANSLREKHKFAHTNSIKHGDKDE